MTQAAQIEPPQPFDAKDGIRIAVQMAVDGEAHARELSPQQARILNMYVDGLCLKDICAVLGVSISTVKSHTEVLLGKFHAHSKGEMVAMCLGRR